jgi:hypothetical protein
MTDDQYDEVVSGAPKNAVYIYPEVTQKLPDDSKNAVYIFPETGQKLPDDSKNAVYIYPETGQKLPDDSRLKWILSWAEVTG